MSEKKTGDGTQAALDRLQELARDNPALGGRLRAALRGSLPCAEFSEAGMGRVGRPPSDNPRKHLLSVRLTATEYRALMALAAARGVSTSEALRSLIEPAVKKLVREVAGERRGG